MSTVSRKKMDSRKQKATVENRYLPDDVLWNIFMRLPAKLLAQMKSLCKPWNGLISHPSFIKSHLHHSVHNNPEVLLVLINEAKFTAHSSRSPHIQLTDFIKPPPLDTTNDKPNYSPTTSVIGSVNGLICFYADKCIHIWNPSLSALMDIPPCTYSSSLFRFGFDPKNDDYKIVGVTFFVFDDNIVTESVQAEVYSIRKGLWEPIKVKFPSHITFILEVAEVVVDGYDGRLHWICYTDPGWYEQTILAFDLGVETFTEIPLPDSIRFAAFNDVGVLSQKLCVISCNNNVEGGCEVWVMSTYGVAKSWVKHHVLKHGSDGVFGFTLSNKFLFVSPDHDLALYDPNDDAVRGFNLTKRAGCYALNFTKIVPYIDSLVWVATPKRVPSLQSEKKPKKSSTRGNTSE